jgi:hypothetical protein
MQKIGICLFLLSFLILAATLGFAAELDKYAQPGFISGLGTLVFACFFTMFGAVGWQASSSK